MKSYLHSRLLVMLGIAVVLGIAYRVFIPPWIGIEKETPVGNLTAAELFRLFSTDPPEAHFNYGDQVIIIEGVVAAVEEDAVVLGSNMEVVKCRMRQSIYDRPFRVKPGDEVALKGVCRGLNLTEVLVTHCVPITGNLD